MPWSYRRLIHRHFPIPAAMYALESVAAGLFYCGLALGVAGMIGLARYQVERRPNQISAPPIVTYVLLVVAFILEGLAILCFIASPRHILPF